MCSHMRIPGFRIRRRFQLADDKLLITDKCERVDTEYFTSIHSFVLAPEIQAEIIDDRVILVHNLQNIASIAVIGGTGTWEIEEQLYIGSDRFQYTTTKKLRFISKNQNKISFILQF